MTNNFKYLNRIYFKDTPSIKKTSDFSEVSVLLTQVAGHKLKYC